MVVVSLSCASVAVGVDAVELWSLDVELLTPGVVLASVSAVLLSLGAVSL